jgi:hypothetical protein
VVGISVTALALLFSLFGSSVAVLTVATFVMKVPGGVCASIFTTSVKVSSPGAAKALLEQVIFPVPPGAGMLQPQPAGEASETNVVLAGTWSNN